MISDALFLCLYILSLAVGSNKVGKLSLNAFNVGHNLVGRCRDVFGSIGKILGTLVNAVDNAQKFLGIIHDNVDGCLNLIVILAAVCGGFFGASGKVVDLACNNREASSGITGSCRFNTCIKSK